MAKEDMEKAEEEAEVGISHYKWNSCGKKVSTLRKLFKVFISLFQKWFWWVNSRSLKDQRPMQYVYSI